MDLTVRSKSWQADDQSWKAAAHGTDLARSISVDAAAFTPATHAPNGFLPSGLPVAKITASGLYGPYTTGGAGGLGTLAGFLEVNTVLPSPNTGAVGTAMFEHGRVVKANVPIITVDSAGETAVAGRISFE